MQPASVTVRRGEVWWVNINAAQGGETRQARPAVVMTADALNRARRTVVVVPLAAGPAPHSPIVVATPSAGANWAAICDQLRAVDKRRLVHNSGRLSAADLRAIDSAIRRLLEL